MKRRFQIALLLLLPLGLFWGLHEYRSWQPQVIYKANGAWDIEVSPDGKMVAVSGNNQLSEQRVMLIDIETSKAAQQFPAVSDSAMCFSPDESQIAVRNYDDLTLYNRETGKRNNDTKLPASENASDDFRIFWPRANTELTALSAEQSLFLVWDTESGKITRNFRLGNDILNDVEISPNANLIAGVNQVQHIVYNGDAGGPNGIDQVVGQRRGIRLWDVQTGKLSSTLDSMRQSRLDVAFSFDGALLASDVTPTNDGGTNAIQIWNPHTGQLLRTLPTPPNCYLNTLQFAPTENVLAVAVGVKTVLLWNASNGVLLREIKHLNNEKICDICFSPDGKTLFIATYEGTITRYRIR